MLEMGLEDSLFWILDARQLCFLPFWFSFTLPLILQGFTLPVVGQAL